MKLTLYFMPIVSLVFFIHEFKELLGIGFVFYFHEIRELLGMGFIGFYFIRWISLDVSTK